MEKINVSLTVQQIIYTSMVINEKIHSNQNLRTAFVQRGDDGKSLERLDAETKMLTEIFQAIQEAL